MPLFPRQAPRVYVECPRCHTPHAFITCVRVETLCAFCPLCQCIWDSIRGEDNRRAAGITTACTAS